MCIDELLNNNDMILVLKDLSLNEHERLSNITACSKIGYGCTWTLDTNLLSNITLKQKLK